ncbi:MAG: hypothetical protein N2111_12075 [Candidatus Sumerlaeaceae bacterium]|nr:hypothetical protein [Candidatus Sumerlaeaceae bacterium]
MDGCAIRLFVWVLVAAVYAMSPVAAWSGDSPYVYGIHWYGDEQSSDVEEMSCGLPLWVLETVCLYDDTASLRAQEAKFRAIAAKGHTLVLRVQPRWGWAVPAPDERAKYLDDLEAAAREAAPYCRHWQIGNEMNLFDEYGKQRLEPADYAAFYREARERLRRVASPRGPVMALVGPVSPGGFYQEVRFIEGWRYLDEVCQALGPGQADGFAIHAYGAYWKDVRGALEDFRECYRQQLHVLDSTGFSTAPVYMLEWNRQSTPKDNPAQEAISAAFLQSAFLDLQAWNAQAATHPIVCATWFIYADAPAWEIFSILHLKAHNPRGPDSDLWDAFQASCRLGIPAGRQVGLTPAVMVRATSATVTGAWTRGEALRDKSLGEYLYRFPSPDARVEFSAPLPSPGRYAVYAWWPTSPRATRAARFEIAHAGGSQVVTADQRHSGGAWRLLGEWQMSEGRVVLSGNSADPDGVICADAVKFVKQGE